METYIELENANCTRCHNRVVAALRARPRVAKVRADFSAGCIVVEHDDDAAELVGVAEAMARAVVVASNGERVMVAVEAHQAHECHFGARVARDAAASGARGPGR
ncbi:MAG: hypothetical protein M0004_13240 [Actinomycetota bacterium]|nr:hypothetical protein [Actinomycetota bacterium]